MFFKAWKCRTFRRNDSWLGSFSPIALYSPQQKGWGPTRLLLMDGSEILYQQIGSFNEFQVAQGFWTFNWSSRWLFQTFCMFNLIWGRFPFWLIFFRWVETTNQLFIARKHISCVLSSEVPCSQLQTEGVAVCFTAFAVGSRLSEKFWGGRRWEKGMTIYEKKLPWVSRILILSAWFESTIIFCLH